METIAALRVSADLDELIWLNVENVENGEVSVLGSEMLFVKYEWVDINGVTLVGSERAPPFSDAVPEIFLVPEASVTELWELVAVEAIGEDLTAAGVDRESEAEAVTKARVLVTTLPFDLVNSPTVSKTVDPREFTKVR